MDRDESPRLRVVHFSSLSSSSSMVCGTGEEDRNGWTREKPPSYPADVNAGDELVFPDPSLLSMQMPKKNIKKCKTIVNIIGVVSVTTTAIISRGNYFIILNFLE